ncbi:MAG: hypothetical protein ABWZ25_15670 [Chitinophagaceae bacterium]
MKRSCLLLTFLFFSCLVNSQSPKPWVRFSLPEKAFAVEFPGDPERNTDIESGAEGTIWNYTAFGYSDVETGSYYLMHIKDLTQGYRLDSDTTYFRLYKESLASYINSITLEKQERLGSLNAYHLEGMTKEDDYNYRTYTVARGNRIYTLLAVSENDKSGDAANRFFSSFRILGNEPGNWSRQTAPDGSFSTLSPGVLRMDTIKGEDGQPLENPSYRQYSTYNPNDVVTYTVQAFKFNKYYWATSDTAMFAEKLEGMIDNAEVILNQQRVKPGNLEGLEVLVDDTIMTNHQKALFVPNGNEIYLVTAWLMPEEAEKTPNISFFRDLRIKDEKGTAWLLKNKTAELLAALTSSDSSTQQEALEALADAPFTVDDLPLIHQSLLTQFYDDTLNYYEDVRHLLNTHLMRLNDPSTVEFIRKNYKNVPVAQYNARDNMLALLMTRKTEASYLLLKELLVDHTPLVPSSRYFDYRVYDSLSLSVKLFPDVLRLLKNPFYAGTVSSLASELVNDSLLSFGELRPYRSDLLAMGKRLQDSIKVSEEYSPDFGTDLLQLLAKFKDQQANEIIQGISRLRKDNLSYQALILLLKNGQPVKPGLVDSFAARKGFRSYLFAELEKMGKTALFPVKYRSQRLLSESDMYMVASLDEEPGEIKFITEKTITHEGKKQKVFLYRIRYDYDEPEFYLGVSGYYSTDPKKLSSAAGDLTGVYFSEQYDSKKMEELLSGYLEEIID